MISQVGNYDCTNESVVSPVIGVILMVGITVAFVALVAVVVFDIGGDVSEPADATVQLQKDSGGVEARVLQNENVDSFKLENEDGISSPFSSSAGDYSTLEAGDGKYTVIAVMSDGTEQVFLKETLSGVGTDDLETSFIIRVNTTTGRSASDQFKINTDSGTYSYDYNVSWSKVSGSTNGSAAG